MIITKLNLDDVNNVSECSIKIENESKIVDVIEMLKYLDRCQCKNHIYINWDKHLFGKNILEIV